VEARHFRFWPDGVPTTITIPDQSVYQNLVASAADKPDNTAAIYYGATLSYAELKHEVDWLAGFLQQRCNVRKGDRVLLDMQNSPQFMIAYYAIIRADAMVVPVNPMNLTEELRHFVSDSGARTILGGQELYPQIRPLVDEGLVDHVIVACYSEYAGQPEDFSRNEGNSGSLKLPESVSAAPLEIADRGITLWHDAIAAKLTPAEHTVHGDDRCVMPYTSGTTGHPKGCIHTHRTVLSTILIGSEWMQDKTNDELVLLGTLPIFHVTGMQSCMNGPIQRGATVVLMTRWDRDMAADLIQRYRVDAWTNISTMVIDFLGNPDLGRYDISSLRHISGGGATMPKAVAQRLNDLTGLSYIEGYGLSETMAPRPIAT